MSAYLGSKILIESVPAIGYFASVGAFFAFVQVLEASISELTLMIIASALATIGGMAFYLWIHLTQNRKKFDWKLCIIHGLLGAVVGMTAGLLSYEYVVPKYGLLAWLGLVPLTAFLKDIVILVCQKWIIAKSQAQIDKEK
jgi:hypothetical protein